MDATPIPCGQSVITARRSDLSSTSNPAASPRPATKYQSSI
jgi:hypothetical protein